jgi:signal transduction histidine kinase
VKIRTPSLLWTFTGAFLVVLILGVILQIFVFFAVVRPATRHWLQAQGEVLSRAGAREVGRALEDNPNAVLEPILASVTRRSGAVLLIYRDAGGRIIAADRPMGPRRREFLEQLAPGQDPPDRLHPPPGGPPGLRIQTAVMVAGQPTGEVIALVPVREIMHWPEGMPRPGLLFLPIVVLLAGGAGFILFRILARRLQQLEGHAERVAAGDLETRIPNPGDDEVGRLGQSLNRMSGRLEEARRRLEEAERQRRRFLADVTHELSTPLTSIRGYAETLLDPGVPTSADERQTYLRDIMDEARRMDLLIADLLDLARLEGAAADFEQVELNWVDLCREVVRRFQPFFADKEIRLQWQGGVEPSQPVRVLADGRRLEQVLTNLLTNALRYVPTGGTVELALQITPGSALLSVDDNGPGFSTLDLPHVFDRFYRADPSRTAGGTGLGLAIVREIVRGHGGTVQAENRPEGGARLLVALPRRDG